MSDQTSTNRPPFSSRSAKKIIGKHVLVGFTYLKADGSVDRQAQHHGVVIGANSRDGVVILEHPTAKNIVLPPDLRSWRKAEKGSYRLVSTGEVVEDPDYISDWVIESDGDKPEPIGAGTGIDSSSSSVYGTGTMLYGRSHRNADESYVATKWVTILYLPVYPMASFRIHNRKAAMALHPGSSSRHQSEPVRLDIYQILRTYFIAYSLFAVFLLLAFLPKS